MDGGGGRIFRNAAGGYVDSAAYGKTWARARLSLLLARIGTTLETAADEWLAPSGLTGRDYAVLLTLATDAPDAQQQLARLLGKAPGIAVIAVDRLEEAGLAERRRNPADRRHSQVVVTAPGARALKTADNIVGQGLAQLLPGLNRQNARSSATFSPAASGNHPPHTGTEAVPERRTRGHALGVEIGDICVTPCRRRRSPSWFELH
ncbi:MarR family winged helix-turn-helix transcriptional regulator [Streptomyces sp. NBC_00448]|uniref:MarR family winged helix-turn-helix transcriptional regulator n=1 Tax=Streptomyces sp. NBC_00448 TaxID=2903652 RepID=UPI002E240841